MPKSSLETTAQELLAEAGIIINGPNPWDIQVKNPAFYKRVLSGGSLALGESYMDGWWECEALDEFVARVIAAKLETKVRNKSRFIWEYLKARFVNLQSTARAFEVGEKHYDLGNDLYQAMLDSRMTYTCGYWKDARTLEEAQEAKLDLVCRKVGLKPGMRVLDIGCGWGSFAKFAAERYGVSVVGITISKEQAALAQERCSGLSVEIRVQDYREVTDQFDRIISLGMFEHVGPKNYHTYMQVVERCLKPSGLFLLHTIGSNITGKVMDPWINKYIFPNAFLPSPVHITRAVEGIFIMEDWHNFGSDYDRTLQAWYYNFNQQWSGLRARYDERFYRMWRFYLLTCAGLFRARSTQLWQVVFSKKGVPGGYQSLR